MPPRLLIILLAMLVVVFLATQWISIQAPEQATHTQNDHIPMISYLDILTNPEFQSGMIKALRENNLDEMKRLQGKAIEIALAAELSNEERSLLEGDKGLKFMQFRAKRSMFMDDFSYLFNQLLPIDKLKTRYPEASDLFAEADALIAQRDKNIKQIARQLAEGGDPEPFLIQARQQWKDKAAMQNKAATLD